MNRKYEAHKEQAANRQREQSRSGRDLGKLPPVKNKRRRNKAGKSLRYFLETYFPETFALGWSDDHLEFIADVERVIKKGGRKAVGMPRGSGKTSILTRACMWGMAYGYRRFIALIGAEEQSGADLADIIRAEWETNDLLREDFPEIAVPIRALEGINQRANAQTVAGKRTHIEWTGTRLRFPTIEGAPGSGAAIQCCGILGRIRGMQYVDPLTGKTVRPDCCLIDDFQTDASARSEVQCSTRELTINGAVMGLSGPGKTLACLASSTIIRHGDAASRMFNRVLYPRWRGSVYKLVYQWPQGEKAEKLWEEYLEIRAAELADGIEEHPKANSFYRRNRKAMDRGAKPAWEQRRLPHELSAIQHAYGLRADNPDSFDAEYQNDPKDPGELLVGLHIPTSDEIVIKQGSHRRGSAPKGATRVFAGIDVQGSSLWWYMAAVDEQFSGWTVDRGVWPPQPQLGPYFTLAQVEQQGTTIEKATGEKRPEAALRIALSTLCESLFQRDIKSPSGEILKLERCLVDDGYMSRHVQAFCRSSELAVMPAKGIGVTKAQVPWSQTRRKPGERRGPGWKMPPVFRTDEIRHVVIDTNYWSTFLAHRWNTPIGAPGAWSLYKAPHALLRMLADHLSSETAHETFGRGRKLYEWEKKVGSENHWKDAERMTAVAASISGVTAPGEADLRSVGVSAETTKKKKKPKKSMAQRKAELEKKKRAA